METKNLFREKCPKCSKEFRTKIGYTTHVNDKICELGPYLCKFCNKSYKLKASHKKHELNCNGEKKIDTRRYKCDGCNKKFTREKAFKNHKCHKCQVCDKIFLYKSHLKIHEAQHSTERKHKCEHCNKTFKLKHHLQNHLNICK